MAAVVGVFAGLALATVGHVIGQAEDDALRAAFHAAQASVAGTAEQGRDAAAMVAARPVVRDALAQRDRDRLREAVGPAFDALAVQAGVRWMQVHGANGETLVRFASSGRLNDSEEPLPKRLPEADGVRDLRSASGLEVGSYGLVVRTVHPVEHEGWYVGSVDVGLDAGRAVVATLSQNFGVQGALYRPAEAEGEWRRVAGQAVLDAAAGDRAAALAGGVVIRRLGTPDGPMTVLSGPLRDGSGEPVAVVDVVMDAQPYARQMGVARNWTMGGGAVSLLVGVLGAGLLARRAVGPLERLAAAARRLKAGDVAAGIPDTTRHDEVGELARALESLRCQTRETLQMGRSCNLLAAIVENSDDAITGKTVDGIVTSWNGAAERMYGYSAEEAVGRSVLDLIVPPALRQEAVMLMARVCAGSRVQNYETERVRRDGTTLLVSLTLSPIRDGDRVIGISTIARDVTEQRRSERALQRINRAMRTLSRCNEALVHATKEGQLFDDMIRILSHSGGYVAALAGLCEGDAGTGTPAVRVTAVTKADGGILPRTGALLGTGDGPMDHLVRRVLSENAPVVLREVDLLTEHAAWRQAAVEEGFSGILACPLQEKGQPPLGVLVVFANERIAFDAEEMSLLGELAGDLAYGIGVLRTREAFQISRQRMAATLERTVEAVAATIEMRDPYTAGHQRRVARLAAAVAEYMGLSPDAVKAVRLAGTIHDIGKIYVPAEILSRPGRLTHNEMQLIREHARIGYEIIRSIDFDWPIAQMILQHHERLDGSGYPQGLKGDAILLEAQILSVADVLEAMATHRPYRPGLGLAAALQEIRSMRGTGLRADVVDAAFGVAGDRALLEELHMGPPPRPVDGVHAGTGHITLETP